MNLILSIVITSLGQHLLKLLILKIIMMNNFAHASISDLCRSIPRVGAFLVPVYHLPLTFGRI